MPAGPAKGTAVVVARARQTARRQREERARSRDRGAEDWGRELRECEQFMEVRRQDSERMKNTLVLLACASAARPDQPTLTRWWLCPAADNSGALTSRSCSFTAPPDGNAIQSRGDRDRRECVMIRKTEIGACAGEKPCCRSVVGQSNVVSQLLLNQSPLNQSPLNQSPLNRSCRSRSMLIGISYAFCLLHIAADPRGRCWQPAKNAASRAAVLPSVIVTNAVKAVIIATPITGHAGVTQLRRTRDGRA
jgi:hypothetical protein